MGGAPKLAIASFARHMFPFHVPRMTGTVSSPMRSCLWKGGIAGFGQHLQARRRFHAGRNGTLRPSPIGSIKTQVAAGATGGGGVPEQPLPRRPGPSQPALVAGLGGGVQLAPRRVLVHADGGVEDTRSPPPPSGGGFDE